MNLAELFHHETDLLDVPAGAALFTEGDSADKMYVLLHGEAKVLVAGVTVEESGPGCLLGEMALVDRSPRSATVVATTDCKFVPIDERRFFFLITQTPNFAIYVMKVMANRLRRTDRVLAELAKA